MSDNPRNTDPILDELHAVRRKMHDDCGGDIKELVARMRERQDQSGHPIAITPVRSSQIPKESTGAAEAGRLEVDGHRVAVP